MELSHSRPKIEQSSNHIDSQRETRQEANINEMMGFGHRSLAEPELWGPRTSLLTSMSREVIHEAAVNAMMNFGHQSSANNTLPDSRISPPLDLCREVQQKSAVNGMMEFSHHSSLKSVAHTRTPSPTSARREVKQEAAVNMFMGFGHHRKAASTVRRPSGVAHYQVDAVDPFSLPSRIAMQGLTHVYMVPQERPVEDNLPYSSEQKYFTELVNPFLDPDSHSSRISTEASKISSITNGPKTAESSPSSRKLLQPSITTSSSDPNPTPTPAKLHRPATPYPPMATPSGRPSRYYATLPLPSSQNHTSTREHATPGADRSKTPPPRLPPSYRASSLFSFARPVTPTPFSRPGIPTITPTHPHFNAPRISGVELECIALRESVTTGPQLRRTMWPEQRRELREEVLGMARMLGKSVRVVRVEEEGEEGEKGKKGWWRRLVGWRKKTATESMPTQPNVESGEAIRTSAGHIGPELPGQLRRGCRHSANVLPSNNISALARPREQNSVVIAPAPAQSPPEPKSKKQQRWYLTFPLPRERP